MIDSCAWVFADVGCLWELPEFCDFVVLFNSVVYFVVLCCYVGFG